MAGVSASVPSVGQKYFARAEARLTDERCSRISLPRFVLRGSTNIPTSWYFTTSNGLFYRTAVGHGSEHPFLTASVPFPHLSLPIPLLFPVLVDRNNLDTLKSGLQLAVEVVQRLLESGVYARVLGNVAYVMVSPMTPVEACGELMAAVASVVGGLSEEGGGGAASSRSDWVAHNI